jgi:hypothetical protein
VALLPRLGWLVTAVATVATLSVDSPGAALLVGFALVPVPLLLRRHGLTWSVPALAPVLGLATVAGAYPALAGRAQGWFTRAALGALGAWWALLAAPLLGRAMLVGDGRDAAAAAQAADPGDGFQTVQGLVTPGFAPDSSVDEAVNLVLRPLFDSGVLLYVALWAVAAAILPWIVRGRWLAIDFIGACAWAAGLGAATVGIADAIGVVEPRHAVAASVLAGVLALAIPHLRRVRVVEP